MAKQIQSFIKQFSMILHNANPYLETRFWAVKQNFVHCKEAGHAIPSAYIRSDSELSYI